MAEHWRRNNYTLTEVHVLKDSTAHPTQLVLQEKGGGNKVIIEVHRSTDPLRFFPFTNFDADRWHSDVKQKLAVFV